jgi:hypothetical protein
LTDLAQEKRRFLAADCGVPGRRKRGNKYGSDDVFREPADWRHQCEMIVDEFLQLSPLVRYLFAQGVKPLQLPRKIDDFFLWALEEITDPFTF